MGESSIAVEIRDEQVRGKGAARKMRAAGRIPGIVYGPGRASVSISIDPTSLEQLIETSQQGLKPGVDGLGPSAWRPQVDHEEERSRRPRRPPAQDPARRVGRYLLGAPQSSVLPNDREQRRGRTQEQGGSRHPACGLLEQL